jgi:hypothetical protein
LARKHLRRVPFRDRRSEAEAARDCVVKPDISETPRNQVPVAAKLGTRHISNAHVSFVDFETAAIPAAQASVPEPSTPMLAMSDAGGLVRLNR